MSRTRRRGYTGSKRFDASCRSHGSCPWCQSNRKHKDKRRDKEAAMKSENHRGGSPHE